MGSPLTMPLQGLNHNEYWIESGVPAPQARNFAFLGHSSVKTCLFFFHLLFTRRLARISFGRLGEGANDSLGAFGGSTPEVLRLPS